MSLAALLFSTVAKQSWFWGTAAVIVLVLLLANVVLFLMVYARRLREAVRARRTARFERECEQMLDELTAGSHDPKRLRARASAGSTSSSARLPRPCCWSDSARRRPPSAPSCSTRCARRARSTCSCARFGAVRRGGEPLRPGRSGRSAQTRRCPH